jgi:CHAT domain-containing protein
VGKGARNRARRKKATQKAPTTGLTEPLLGQLFAVKDLAVWRDLLSKRPELLDRQVLDELRALGAHERYGAPFQHFADLLDRSRTNVEAAWDEYARARSHVDGLVRELAGVDKAIEAASKRRDFDEVLTLIEDAIPKASEAGLGMMVAHLQGQRGVAYLNRASLNRAQDLEYAIESLEEALELTTEPEEAADHLMHLAIVWSERIRGDRAENLERSVTLFRDAIRRLTPASPPDLHAMMRTNLAMALMRTERDDRNATLREAAELCRTALEYRSPERDAVNWAYTQLNLGEVLQELAELGEIDAAEAIQTYEEVIHHEQHLRDKWLVGAAHHSLGRYHISVARITAEEMADADDGDLENVLDNGQSLETARKHLVAARQLMRTCPDPVRRGRVLDDLSDVLADLEADEEAVEVAREALSTLRPTTAPRWCANVGGRLGDLLAKRGEWAEAAAAFSDAVDAADFNFHTRLDTASREEETRRAGNLSRWAAFAIARNGDPVAAALVLENGRARELRRRLGLQGVEESRLGELTDELREAYLAAVGNIAASPIGHAGASTARQLQEVLEVIRQAPGFEDFSTGARFEDLAAALEPGWPLVYVNPTSYGTLLLRLYLGESGPSVDTTFLNDVTSIEIFMRLMIGDAVDLEDPTEADDYSSYLFGISGGGDADRDFRKDLEEILPWLGTTIAEPIHNSLTEVNATGATLVCCGPVGVAPLHVAPWNEGERCLLDDFDVRYAPSAVLEAASLERAATRSTVQPNLVAVGDPTEDLPAAVPEIEEIAREFPDGRAVWAFGRDADRRFLQFHARSATHLHLACHSRGGLFDADDAAVLLADGLSSATDLTALAGLQTRLVAISSCQSALPEIAGLPDEVISIGTAMLAAGSACAVASLWSVDDLATALLMTRMYEEMLQHDRRPPEALGRAQLWLRTLTPEDESTFLSEHPALEAEFRRRAALDDPPGIRRSPNAVSGSGGPYSHPAQWAAFVAMGS